MADAMRIYTVVDVMAGVAVGAKSFPRPEEAKAYLNTLRGERSAESDDVQIFEDEIIVAD